MDYKKLNEKLQTLSCMDTKAMESKDRFYASTAIENPKKISYFTQQKLDKIQEIGSEKIMADYGSISQWHPAIREKFCIMTKQGKFFKYINPELSDSELQNIVARWFNIIQLNDDEREFNFELKKEISFYYNEENYFDHCGNLGSSCMSYASCSSYIDFYNHYNCSLLILKNQDNKITGRALIWHDVFFKHLDKTLDFMDRVYINNQNDEMRFFDYCEKNNIVRKKYQSYSNKTDFFYNEKVFYDVITIECQNTFNVNDMEYPYIDTLSYMDDDCDLCNYSNSSYFITCNETDGTCSGTGCYVCEDCGHRFNPDNEGIYIENYGGVCESCRDNYSYCDSCATYVSIDEISCIGDDYVCQDCFDDHYHHLYN